MSHGGVHSPVRCLKICGSQSYLFERAKGAKIWDVEGKEYIDFCLSFGPLLLGHRHFKVQKAVQKMIKQMWSIGSCEPYSLELAQLILSVVEKTSPDMKEAQIRFVSSGTEAVMTALRLARAYTKRSKVLNLKLVIMVIVILC